MDELEVYPEDAVSRITENVAVTNFVTAHGDLSSYGIKAVLCLDSELPGDSAETRGLEAVEVFGLVDGKNSRERFRRAVELLATMVSKHGKVLVHCRAGKSRSLAVVAGYLVRTEGLSATAALSRTCELRKTHRVASELLELLREYANVNS